MDIRILYEDNHLLIVEKPPNIPVQEDRTGDKDLLTLLKEDIKVRFSKPGNVYLGLVHRLDRPVGGVMVFAKTSKAASRLADELRRQAIGRTYVAVVRGTPAKKKGKLVHYLVKDARENKVHVVDAKQKDAKQAVLDYEVIASSDQLSLLSVNLHTGRPHQIRVQLAAIGCPLYGDQKYGVGVNRPGQQIALWAQSLKLTHPTKKEEVSIQSSPPLEYPWNLFNKLR
ncbi:pseudouridine synthase [Bacillus sp. OxB-1]|uniref:RluA family pseudouridine synthase n=1 Tax=Bacillus sp. (strain OxB-1) TaxID=98228 RepID=UPI0005822918|nr:RNA pseudouridine synthase [Bacillus sp. OxB-1]BAQ10734.1 pseudouridine synthase [Bacillus sp. OxB-1]